MTDLTTTDDCLSVRQEEGVLVASMKAVASRNALSANMKAGLLKVASAYAEDPRLRCLVITGSADVFCAGGDLRTMADNRNPQAVRERLAQIHQFARLLTSCEKPVVMAVNGAAVGAGLSLALLGDVVVASDAAYFMPGFSKVSVLPDLGLLHRLPKAVGMPLAKDMLFTNRRLQAHEALACGLVSRVYAADRFQDDVLAMACDLARGPTLSMGLAKTLLDAAWREGLDTYLDRESLAQAVIFGSEDFAEGHRAFLEKRPPAFTGR